jgi:hypothetical protein
LISSYRVPATVLKATSNNTPTVTAVEGAGSNTSIQISGAAPAVSA